MVHTAGVHVCVWNGVPLDVIVTPQMPPSETVKLHVSSSFKDVYILGGGGEMYLAGIKAYELTHIVKKLHQ